VNFLSYLEMPNAQGIASASTYKGPKVTCLSAMQLSDYLIDSCNFLFVMLTRFSQDNLEVKNLRS
jgi:hypothetical protein